MFPYFIHETKSRSGSLLTGVNQLIQAMTHCLNLIVSCVSHDFDNPNEEYVCWPHIDH